MSPVLAREPVPVAVVLGTRPEAIKMAPVIRALHASDRLRPVVVSTGQHRQMLDQMLLDLDIQPDVDLAVMEPRQSLGKLTARLTERLESTLAAHEPAAVLVQGDTTTALCGALTAFYQHLPVGHVEAGLRSGALDNPFPEEANRKLIGQLARWHWAPTPRAAANLLAEAVSARAVSVTGNTSIDNLVWALDQGRGKSAFVTSERKILVTLHRRENQGETMAGLAATLAALGDRGDTEIVLPLHLSPAVREVLRPVLERRSAVRLVDPLDYFDFLASMVDCELILTDSGGVQEEAPTLGKPVLVLRENTERPEAVEAGVARLAGVEADTVLAHAQELLEDSTAYEAMARAGNPYGDGQAAGRIVRELEESLATV